MHTNSETRLAIGLGLAALILASVVGACGLTLPARIEDVAVSIALDPRYEAAGSQDVTSLVCPRFTEAEIKLAVQAPHPPFDELPYFVISNPLKDRRVYIFHYPIDQLHSVDLNVIFGADCAAFSITSYV